MPRVQPIDGSGVAANRGRLQDGPTQLPPVDGRPLPGLAIPIIAKPPLIPDRRIRKFVQLFTNEWGPREPWRPDPSEAPLARGENGRGAPVPFPPLPGGPGGFFRAGATRA